MIGIFDDTRSIIGIFSKFILKYLKKIPSALRYAVRTYTVKQNDFRPQKWFCALNYIVPICIYYGS